MNPNLAPWKSHLAIARIALLWPCLAGYLWQGFVHQVWGISLLGLAIAIGFGCGLLHAATSGEMNTGHATIYRATQPLAFWLIMALELLCYVTIVLAMFVAGPFSLPPK